VPARYDIIDVEQGSPEWHAARCGIPTASRYKDIVAQGALKVRTKYLSAVAREVVSGKPMENYSNEHMERGKREEDEIRAKYAFDHDVDVVRVGFIKMNPQLCATGCSPDGLIGDDGMVEIKSAEPHILIEYLKGRTPAIEHMAQLQGGLWITGRKWVDIVIGCPGLPQAVQRVPRHETYIATLASEVKQFNADLAELVSFLRSKM
jgi:YqaJ-like viral recombinase domain